MKDVEIAWDPDLPEYSGKTGTLWLVGTTRLSFEALRYLRATFFSNVDNLVTLRVGLCNGQRHLLGSDLISEELEAIVAELENLNIGYEIKWGEDQ